MIEKRLKLTQGLSLSTFCYPFNFLESSFNKQFLFNLSPIQDFFLNLLKRPEGKNKINK